jgi:hypothetical protein
MVVKYNSTVVNKWNKKQFIEKTKSPDNTVIGGFVWGKVLETYNQILSDIISQERDDKLAFILDKHN